MVGGDTQRAPHTGINFYHRALIWAARQSFDIGKGRLARR